MYVKPLFSIFLKVVLRKTPRKNQGFSRYFYLCIFWKVVYEKSKGVKMLLKIFLKVLCIILKVVWCKCNAGAAKNVEMFVLLAIFKTH